MVSRKLITGLVLAIVNSLAMSSYAEKIEQRDRDEVRSLVAELMADAETRSSLLQSGSTAGHDGRFFIRSEDGNYSLSIGGLLQFRYSYNHLEGADEDDPFGFFIPRARLWFQGATGEGISYRIRGQFSGTKKEEFAEEVTIGGIFELDQVWVNFRLADQWGLRIGQQSSEFSRENDLAPEAQLGVNASPTDSVFGFGGYQGIRLNYEGESLRTFFTFSDGIRNKNSDVGEPRNADYALTLKSDWLLAGEWSRFSDFTSRPGSDLAVMFGAGVHWENGAQIGDPAENLALLGGIAELSLEGNGWSIFGAFHYLRNTFLSAANDELDDFGLVVQASMYISDSIEPFVRFDAVYPDADRDRRNQEFRTLTGGFNFYPIIGTNAAKFSFDVMYMFDDEAGALVDPSKNTGVFASTDGGQIAIRGQFSLVF